MPLRVVIQMKPFWSCSTCVAKLLDNWWSVSNSLPSCAHVEEKFSIHIMSNMSLTKDVFIPRI